MAVDKLVDSSQLDANLTSVANAIRTRGGTSASLAFPADFISAIGNIPSGGGYTVKDMLYKNEPGGDAVVEADADIPPYSLVRNTSITKLTLDLGTYKIAALSSGQYSGNGYNFNYNNIAVYHIISNNTDKIPSYCFQSDAAQVHVVVIRGQSNGCLKANAFRNDAGLTVLDYTFTGTNTIEGTAFMSANKFSTFIIRGSAVCPLANINAFTSATYWKSGGTGGTLYVPQDLISSYQSATNWSTILGYTSNNIKSIESTHTDPTAPFDMTLYYADGTPIPTS